MHTIQSIKRLTIESAIANGAANTTPEIHAYSFGYLAAYLAQALNQIDALEARHGAPAIQFDNCPDLLKRQAG